MEEGAAVDDAPPDDANEGESDFVEKDPTGRYGRYDEVLGKGAFKTVYKAFDDLDGIEVAWNQVKVHDVLHNAGDIERLYSELHLLKTLKHKNIIKFYNSWVDARNKTVNFITEIFTSGTLRQYRKKHKHVNLKAIKHWSRQILRGLVFLHSRDPPVIHRDLKCDNIFINGNSGEVKIGDLGLATILRQAPAAQSVLGTPEFMAPELYEEHYTELVDIYSFGMCLLEMLTAEYPYSECTNAAQIYRKVTMGKKPAALTKISDPETRQFVEKCLATASERLHARELLMDPFLRNDEDFGTLEPSRVTIRNSYENLRALDSIPEDSHVSSAPSAQKLEETSTSDQLSSPRKLMIVGDDKAGSFNGKSHALDSLNQKGGPKSIKRLQIKGRKQDDRAVFVRIRIANAAGEVRIVQFDFDVEADTAISVAKEMVLELDLSEQDITTIANMIDSEVMALIPDWKPGLATDEAVDDDAKEQNGPVAGNLQVEEVRNNEVPMVSKSKSPVVPAMVGGSSKVPDANQEQLKKQQVQKSIADLEAKNLHNLWQSNNKYLGGATVKSQAGAALQNGQQGGTAKNHGGATIQQGVPVKSLPGTSMQNGQQGVSFKNVPGAPIQNGQQGVSVKNHLAATFQNGQQGTTGAASQHSQLSATVKTVHAATSQNGQQVAMKNHPGVNAQNGQQSGTVKNLPIATSQNGQQMVRKNHPGVAPPNGQQSGVVNILPCATAQNGQQNASATGAAGSSVRNHSGQQNASATGAAGSAVRNHAAQQNGQQGATAKNPSGGSLQATAVHTR